MPHRFYIYTFGCRLNQSESADMTRQLLRFGWTRTDDYRKAKLVLVNSCCVTQKADKEVRQLLRRIRRENPECFLVAMGCGVEQSLRSSGQKSSFFNRVRNSSYYQYCHRRNAEGEKKEIFTQTPRAKVMEVNLWVGNKIKTDVKKWLPRDYLDLSLITDRYYPDQIDKYHHDHKALIKIQEGCNHFCSYCIVPYVRGRPRSAPADMIIERIKGEVKEGVKEVVLTGVDLGSYQLKVRSEKFKIAVKSLKLHRLKNQLVKLLYLILSETKIGKISFGSMSLSVFDDDFWQLYQQSKNRLSVHFHIPLQSGSEGVLQRMRRPYTAAQFLAVLHKIHKRIPGSSISTDLIVGFPGETEEEFQETVRTIRRIREMWKRKFTKIHTFRYSERPGTLAVRMAGKKGWESVREETKRKRADIMQKIIPIR